MKLARLLVLSAVFAASVGCGPAPEEETSPAQAPSPATAPAKDKHASCFTLQYMNACYDFFTECYDYGWETSCAQFSACEEKYCAMQDEYAVPEQAEAK